MRGSRVRNQLVGAAAVIALAIVAAIPAGAQTPTGTITNLVESLIGPGARLVKVGDFNQPLLLTAPPGDQNFWIVGEKGGKIHAVVGGQTLPTPFLDLTGSVGLGDVGGLLGVAFAPNWASSGKVYVHITKLGSENNMLLEYTRSATNPHAVDPASTRIVFEIPQPLQNHPGGGITFGPDGRLYVAIGDGGQGFVSLVPDPDNNAQRLDTLKGKVLRINPAQSGSSPYTIPADNPYVGVAGAKGEIFHWGVRNPWRIAFDPTSHDMFIGDPGDGAKEEINHVVADTKGINFGWSCYEGDVPRVPARCADGRPIKGPLHQYDNGKQDRCAVIGGLVSRDPRVSRLLGRYLFADFCSGEIFSLLLEPNDTNFRPEPFGALTRKVKFLSSFGEDGQGRVYVMSAGTGDLYRIDPCLIGVICGLPLPI
jgi:hypothetical protein